MPTIRSVLALSLLVTACASGATPRAAAPRTEPAPAVQPVAQPPAPPPGPAIRKVRGGGTPGSNSHMWGSRTFELRGEGDAREIRIHDAVDFQGSGMQPEDMDPTRHTCTPWEPLPADIEETPLGLAGWFHATRPPAPPTPADPAGEAPGTSWNPFWGRGIAPCD